MSVTNDLQKRFQPAFPNVNGILRRWLRMTGVLLSEGGKKGQAQPALFPFITNHIPARHSDRKGGIPLLLARHLDRM